MACTTAWGQQAPEGVETAVPQRWGVLPLQMLLALFASAAPLRGFSAKPGPAWNFSGWM